MVESTLKLGAVRERLIAAGYNPVSLLNSELAPWLSSEHPVGVRTVGNNPLAAIVLTPPKDSELDRRIRLVLARRGLTSGPCRTGSDGRLLWPVQHRSDGFGHSAPDNAVLLVATAALGMGQGVRPGVIPLDAAWSPASLLDVPYAKLPVLEGARELFEELNHLPYTIAAEKRPPPKPSRRAWLGDAS